MKPFFSAAIILTSITIGALSPARAQEANPILLELRPQLQAAMQKVAPDATWELKGNELTASYKTKDFKTYTFSPAGHIVAQPREEIGPDDNGFILRVRVFSQIPIFAAQAPLSLRQTRWKTFMARYSVRAVAKSNSLWPEPVLLAAETPSDIDSQRGLGESSYLDYLKLRKIQNYTLLQFARNGQIQLAPITRLEATITQIKAQQAPPTLATNKERRVQAIAAATSKAGNKFSPAEIEELDKDISDLEKEFANEIVRHQPRTSGISELRPPYHIEPRVILQKTQPAYLVFTLQTPLNYETLSPQPFAQIIEDAARENNRRADEK